MTEAERELLLSVVRRQIADREVLRVLAYGLIDYFETEPATMHGQPAADRIRRALQRLEETACQ